MSDDRSRRDVLVTLAQGAAVALVPVPSSPAHEGAHHGPAAAAAAGAPRTLAFFTPEQMRTVSLLAERILPEDEHSPGARAALVPERIDAVLGGASADRQARWREGLAAVEAACRERFAKPLVEASEAEHDALLESLARNEARPGTAAERLFVDLKSETVEAYYTSKVGLEGDLQYKGNTYLADFPGCTHDAHEG